MKYFITGIPGSGKTTVGKLLEKRGYVFADSDHAPGLANWFNQKTGNKVLPNPNEDADWYREHSWNWNRKNLESLLNKYGEKTIFLCGMTSNQGEDLDLFDKVFLLKVDADESRKSMLKRCDTADASCLHL